ncbi:DNRLRE domain-containing protein [Jiangella muralis]|uniref:golvesin C-terminal-like domain-containing protein n=1 Tax=Jiangella muralis TaxID=702383 RepID=UPI00069E8BDA|nr:DNRLRE domain-containing protein [Jiangella muralis]
MTPQAEGDSVTYADVFGTADLVYRVESTGLKEEIVLEEPPEDATFTFTLQMGGVVAREQEDGSIGFFRPGGEGPAVFEIPKPFMFDSTDTPDAPVGSVRSEDVTQSVVQRGANIEITVAADPAWLADAERVYPVVIDPTIVVEPSPSQGQDAMIRSAAPTTNYGSSWQLGVGTDSTGRARSLLKFDLSWLPAGTPIDAAQLRVWYDQAYHTNANDVLIKAYDAPGAWDESTVTWSGYPTLFGNQTFTRELVDDGDPGQTSQVGPWPFMADTTQSQWGINDDFQYDRTGVTGNTYTWVPRIVEPGRYQVDAHFVASAGRATNAPYTVQHAGGTSTVAVDQTAGTNGVWATLGSWNFNAGTSHRVTVGSVPELRTVVADAVQLTKWAEQTKTADSSSRWHEFSVRDLVQSWVDGQKPNHGFMLRVADETTLGRGGAYYEASEPVYGGSANQPKLVLTYGRPGVTLNPITTIHGTGAELSWQPYAGSDLVEYQVHRSTDQRFTPSAATLVAPVASGTTSFTDTTARPTAAGDPDPFARTYYYMVAVKTVDGTVVPATTQLASLPRAGLITRILQGQAVDTTIASGAPNSNLDVFDGEPWLGAGNGGGSFGTTRALIKFPDLATAVPTGATVQYADLRLWKPSTFGISPILDLHRVTRTWDETTATWNSARVPFNPDPWTTPGGDYDPAVIDWVTSATDNPKWLSWSVTGLVQRWVNGPLLSNFGALIKARNEALEYGVSEFVSNELASEPKLRPMLRVTYLEKTAEGTYYAPDTAVRAEAGEERTVEVTVTNTTAETWTAANHVLSYHWAAPDGTDVTTAGNRVETALPADLAPGETVTLNATVRAPELLEPSNKREDFTLQWDMRNKGSGQWISDTQNIPALDQSAKVEDVTSNELGLEKFYQYSGTATGAGSALMTNVHAGNTVFSYDAFANPSRGVSTFVRMSYNSLDTSASSMGYGWSLATSSLMRMGTPLDLHPRGQAWPTQVTLTDGDGTAHLFRLNKHDSANEEDWDYDSPAGVHLYLQRTGDSDPTRAWVMTSPDRTQFYFDADGSQSALRDKNGNELLFTYEQRKSNNKPIKFLRYITDPSNRQTLTVDYFTKGQAYSYVDDAGAVQQGTNLSNPKIIDQVESLTDISGRTVRLTYTDKGLMARLVDGDGTPEAKTFQFVYEADNTNKNTKLVEVIDPRGNDTDLTFFEATTDPKAKWLLQSITDRAGGTTSFAYTDPDGSQGAQVLTTVTDAKSNDGTYLTDGFGRPLTATNANDETTTLTWDDDHNVEELVEDDGATTSWTYDPGTGYPTSITDAEANANGTAATTLSYRSDLNGHVADLTGKVSPEGRTWSFGYDTVGNLTSVTDPAGTTTATEDDFTTTYAYDGFGQLLDATDANGNLTQYRDYGPTGFPTRIVDAQDNPTGFAYDDRGNVLTVTDTNENTSTHGYDVFGRPGESQVPKDADAGVYIVTPAPVYDANDNVVEATAPNGALTTYSYDPADRMLTTTLPADEAGDPARVGSYEYDLVGNLLASTEPNGTLTPSDPDDFVTRYGYDPIYQLTSVTNADGDVISYRYDSVGNLVTVVDPRKNATTDPDDVTTTTGYDRNHRPTTVTDAAGETSTTAYDLDGLVTEATDQEGNTTLVEYDERGLQREVRVPHEDDGAGGITYRTTRYEYDEAGNRTRVVTPRGVESGDPDAFVHETVYDQLNRPVEQVFPYDPGDPRFNTPESVTYAYDLVGNLTEVSAPPSENQTVRNTTTYTHFDNGWVESTVDAWDIATTYDYNDLGQQTLRTATSAGGSSSRSMSWTYFPDGKLSGRGDDGVPVGQHVVLADNSDTGNTAVTGVWSVLADGTGFQGYDYRRHAAGHGGGADEFTWTLRIPADGTYEVFVRHPAGVTGAATDAPFEITHAGGTATQTVNQAENGGEWASLGSYAFTEDGTHTIALGTSAAGMVFADAVKLVRDTTGQADTEAKDFTYDYDPNGNLVSLTDAGSGAAVDAYEVAYTGLNQVATVEELATGTVQNTTYTYDENGNPLTREHDDQYATYRYDVRDLVDQVSNGDTEADPDPKVTTFGYTPRGQTATEEKANGNTVTYDYFLDGLLERQEETKPDGTLVASHVIGYDANGNRTSDVARTMDADSHGTYLDRTYAYTFDPRDRVAGVEKTDTSSGSALSTETYVHDAASNVISQTVDSVTTSFVYDRNRLLTASSAGVVGTYNYDPFGRLDTVTSAGLVVERYTYDGFDRVASHRSLESDGTSSTTAYAYDPMDRTASRTSDAGAAGEETTEFSYLGLSGEVLSEEVAGQIQTSYQYSPWGQRLSQIKYTGSGGSTEEDSYYGYNPHTDVETLTDTTGNTRATYGYTAYGKDDDTQFTGVDAPDPGNPGAEPYNVYRFNAKRFDPATGSYDMGFRDYSPGLNRFLTRDNYNGALADLNLATSPWTMNRYAFAGGNPITGIEIDGHHYCDTHACSGAALSGRGTASAVETSTKEVAMLGGDGKNRFLGYDLGDDAPDADAIAMDMGQYGVAQNYRSQAGIPRGQQLDQQQTVNLLLAWCEGAELCNQGLKERLVADQMITAAQEVGITGGHFAGPPGGALPRSAANSGGALVRYDADFALGQLTAGGRATASQLDEFGVAQGWIRSQTAAGPVKYTDANGIVRLTIKRGSPRAPGSGDPHIELRNAAGLRVDPYGNLVTRRSVGNHTPIEWDW